MCNIKTAISLPRLHLSSCPWLEGKTDCPPSEVFGAGKTRAAAAIVAGLITVDHTLNIMVLTKENVASQAFASMLCVSTCLNQNSTTGKTQLDSWILTTSRHEVLQSKHVIGCVVAFTMSVPTNTALWLSLTLQDESQQFGNLDEAAAIARMPRKCLVVWLGFF